MHAVVTADVIGSKKLFSEGYTKESFNTSAKKYNQMMTQYILTGFSISRGDEIQGVIVNAEDIPTVVRNLRYFFLPARLRIGIGIGHIDEPIDYENSWDMDGQAFHRARNALDTIKDRKMPCTYVISGNPEVDATANVIYTLINAIEAKWTMPQWEAVYAYERCGTYKAAGEMLGVAAQNVAKRCKVALWNAVKEGEEHMSRLLGAVGREED
jgi:hypothetical protein